MGDSGRSGDSGTDHGEMKTVRELTLASLQEKLERDIWLTVHGEGGMIWRARIVYHGDEEKPLPMEETAENVGKVIWEKAKTRDIVWAAMDCGRLQEFWGLADRYGIQLSEETVAMEEFRYMLDPA